ncbi:MULTISPECIES: NADH oxidase [unclassified Streptomyces]|uniref:NADH oxidase n=1 Tax=unclassified Streptomyces TaxID=2593676 RepID=UPI00339DD036
MTVIPSTEDLPLRMHHLWSLREDTVVGWEEEGRTLVLRGPQGTERVEDPAPAVAEALRRMELGPVLLANLLQPNGGAAPVHDTYTVVLSVLRQVSHVVIRTLSLEDLKGPVLSVVPVCRTARFSLVRLSAQRRVRLRPTVTITVRGDVFLVQCRTLDHRVEIHRPEAMWVVSLLAWPMTPDAMVELLPLPAELTLAILGYLAGAGMTVAAG